MTPTQRAAALRLADEMLIARFREVFVYDNGMLRFKKTLGTRAGGAIAGTGHGKGYWMVGVDRKRYQAHRVIFALHHGYMPEMIDHINCVKDDNRIENLREATRAQNHWNTGLVSRNKSGVKGVSWHQDTKKWMAQCCVNGQRNHIGLFASIDDAALAVEAFRAKHHGEYARHARSVHISGATT